MCIALLSTSHPDYALIVLSNRDEFLSRPTAPAAFWQPPDSHVLGGRDLLRSEQGTWLGMTRQGRIAVLTNFRETNPDAAQPLQGARSRGAMANAWLKLPPEADESTESFVKRLCQEGGLKDIGGFSLLCGRLRKSRAGDIEPLAIVSNRTSEAQAPTWIAGTPGEVYGLSNSAYGDPWPKVKLGVKLLRESIEESAAASETEDALLKRFFNLLSLSTLPERKTAPFEIYLRRLSETIYVPPLEFPQETASLPAHDLAAAKGSEPPGLVRAEEGKQNKDHTAPYGTQKQTVILVGRSGGVTFVERTLFDDNGKAVPAGKGDRKYHFNIEMWNEAFDADR